MCEPEGKIEEYEEEIEHSFAEDDQDPNTLNYEHYNDLAVYHVPPLALTEGGIEHSFATDDQDPSALYHEYYNDLAVYSPHPSALGTPPLWGDPMAEISFIAYNHSGTEEYESDPDTEIQYWLRALEGLEDGELELGGDLTLILRDPDTPPLLSAPSFCADEAPLK